MEAGCLVRPGAGYRSSPVLAAGLVQVIAKAPVVLAHSPRRVRGVGRAGLGGKAIRRRRSKQACRLGRWLQLVPEQRLTAGYPGLGRVGELLAAWQPMPLESRSRQLGDRGLVTRLLGGPAGAWQVAVAGLMLGSQRLHK